MADKAFGVDELNLLGAGTPTIESPNILNINASNVAISTNLTIGGQINSDVIIGNYNVGIGTTIPTNAVDSNNTQILNVGIVTANNLSISSTATIGTIQISSGIITATTGSGIVSFYGDGSGLTGTGGIEIQKDGSIVGSATTTINFATGLLVDPSSDSGIVTVSSLRSAAGGGAGGNASYSDYAEKSHSTHNIIGIETSFCKVGILTSPPQDQAISADGNIIFVGTDDGLYVHERHGGSFVTTTIYATDYSGSAFGRSVACSADGNSIVVGTCSPNRIYLFDRDRASADLTSIQSAPREFVQIGYLDISFEPNEMVCSVDSKTIFVSPTYRDDSVAHLYDGKVVYVYDRIGNELNKITELSDLDYPSFDGFGFSLACSDNGGSLIVGNPAKGGPKNAGIVKVYDRQYSVGIGTTYIQVGILTGRGDGTTTGAELSVDYQFGYSVACNKDASSIIVGEFQGIMRYIYAGPPEVTRYTERSKIGKVHVFDRTNCVGVGTTFTKVGIFTGSQAYDQSDEFGRSLACSADGNDILVGSISTTSSSKDNAYLFNRQGNNFNEVKIFDDLPSGFSSGDKFYVDCSVNAKKIAIGMENENVQVYEQNIKETPLVRAGIGSTVLYIDCEVNGNIFGEITLAGTAPATASSTGIAGQIRYDANYLYVCVATDTWKRTALTTW